MFQFFVASFLQYFQFEAKFYCLDVFFFQEKEGVLEKEPMQLFHPQEFLSPELLRVLGIADKEQYMTRGHLTSRVFDLNGVFLIPTLREWPHLEH